MELTAPETRVLGALIEKHLATPQYYPLTLNALVAACNQSSNREPVVTYSEEDVTTAIAGLREQKVVRAIHSPGQRADKYRHALDDLWGLDEQHLAVLGVLMLRGPQTLGELRARTDRLATFDSLAEVEEVLELLAGREDPLARRLDRIPGQKEARWVELFSGSRAAEELAAERDERRAQDPTARGDVIADIRAEIAELQASVKELQASMTELRALFD